MEITSFDGLKRIGRLYGIVRLVLLGPGPVSPAVVARYAPTARDRSLLHQVTLGHPSQSHEFLFSHTHTNADMLKSIDICFDINVVRFEGRRGGESV